MNHYPELEIYSDFNCTWCYFDKPAIKKLKEQYNIRIIWRAFPLHPDIPEEGMPIEALFGSNIPLMTDKMKKLENMAASLNLPLAKRTIISDSRLSQELAKWAESKDQLEAYHDTIYKAYFSDGLNIADPSVLLDVIDATQLSREEAIKIIETREFAQAVESDWEKSEELAIMAAPTYIMNGTKLTGSQTFEKLEGLMRQNGVEKTFGT